MPIATPGNAIPSPPCQAGTAPAIWLLPEQDTAAIELGRLLQRNLFRIRQLPPALTSESLPPWNDESPLAIIAAPVALADMNDAWRRWIAARQVVLMALLPEASPAACLDASRLGCSHAVALPGDAARLIGLLDELACARGEHVRRVLLVSGDAAEQQLLGAFLRQSGLEVLFATPDGMLLQYIAELQPQVALFGHGVSRDLLTAVRISHWELAAGLIELEEVTAYGSPAAGPGPGFTRLVGTISELLVRMQGARCRSASVQRLLAVQNRITAAINAHAILSVTDASGRIVEVNDRFCEISGYAADELLGSNHSLLKSGLHDAGFYREMWRSIRAGSTWQGEICNRRKDGSLYWVESTITPLAGADGTPESYISLRTDITATKTNQLLLQSLAGISNLDDAAFIAALVQWLAVSLQIKVAFVAVADGQPGWLRSLALWQDGGLQANHAWPIAGTPWELVQRDGMALHVKDLAATCPDAHWLQAQAIEGFLGIVFRAQDGAILGQLGIMDDKPLLDWLEKLEWLRVVAPRIAHGIQRAQYQQELQRRELANLLATERLTHSQRYANIGTWDWNIETSQLYWTDRIPVLFGYPEGGLETTYDNFMAAVHPEDRQLVSAAVDRCIREQVPYDVEHRVIWPDGTIRWLLERGDVIRNAAGKPLHMLGVVQDIDDRKRAELALAESERRLQEAQALAHIGNWSADFRTGELFWSDEIFRIFGAEPASFTPSVQRFRSVVHAEDLPRLLEAEHRAGQTGVLDIVHRIVRPDGSVRQVHELARAEFGSSGEMVRLVGTVQDVTLEARTQQALVKAREEAERANRAKTEFLSSMSHELRTPLNAILGFSQLLEIDAPQDSAQRESITEIRKAGSHLLQLINEVLDLSRIESGSLSLSTEPVHLHEVLRECISLIRPVANPRSIAIAVSVDGEPVVMADRIRLKQVLLNLLSNAVKYNRAGGSVRVAAQEAGRGRLRILVSDTGIGIPQHLQHRVFEAFTRFHDDQGAIEGTGIGLAITRKLVELMGGNIAFESSTDAGSCFHVELPLAEGWTSAPAVTPVLAAGPAGTSAARESRKVLLVDDNPANLRLVGRILERVTQVSLLTAHSASLGLELARAHQPALILLDINMPDMDGYRMLKLLQADSCLGSTPVLAITANALPNDIEKGRAAGFADYLTKPLDIQHFVATLQRHLDLAA